MKTKIKYEEGVSLYEIQSPDPAQPEFIKYIVETPRTPEVFSFNELSEATSFFCKEIERMR